METKTINLKAFAFLAVALFAFALVAAEENSSNVSSNSSQSGEPMLISENTSNSINESLVSSELSDIDDEFNENISSWDINKEKIKNWFTFDQDKKAEREFKIARMLLVRARIEARHNNTEAMDNALDAHNEILQRIQDRIESRKSRDNSTEDADRLVGLERALQVHEIRISRLNSLLDNENLTDDQRSKIEERISKAENVTAKLQDVQDDKIAKLKLRIMAKGNLTEDQANAVIAELKDSHLIEGLKDVLKTAREDVKNDREALREGLKNQRENIKEELKNQREALKEFRKQNRSSDDSKENSSDDDSDNGSSGSSGGSDSDSDN